MSRIDEALKRSQGPVVSRSAARVEAPSRLVKDMTLDDYPVEARAPGERAERAIPPPVPVEPAPFVPARPDVRRAIARPRLDQNEKLVVGPGRNPVSLEQYRRLAASLHDSNVACERSSSRARRRRRARR
jgi:hypothetical protein